MCSKSSAGRMAEAFEIFGLIIICTNQKHLTKSNSIEMDIDPIFFPADLYTKDTYRIYRIKIQ